MSTEKIFLSLNNQVKRLEKRHLHFNDDEERKNAEYTLQNNSYYAVVNGYKDLFCISQEENNEDDYCDELFLNLRDSFDFDKELSALLFKYLLRIEDSFKAIFSYYTGEKYGNKQAKYLSNKAIKLGKLLRKSHNHERDVLFDILNKKIRESHSPQIAHYRKKYGYIPPWVLVSDVSLDSLLYWYKLSNSDIKEKTVLTMLFDCSQYPFTHYTVSEESMELFINLFMIVKEYRNRAAHGNRIMNHKSSHNIKINLLQLYADNRNNLMKIYEGGTLNGDIFSLFIAITIMLSKRGTVRERYINELDKLFSDLKNDNEYLYKRILEKVYLPDNFIELLRGIVINHKQKAPSNEDATARK